MLHTILPKSRQELVTFVLAETVIASMMGRYPAFMYPSCTLSAGLLLALCTFLVQTTVQTAAAVRAQREAHTMDRMKILEALDVGLLLIHANQFLFANDKFYELLEVGRQDEQALGRALEELQIEGEREPLLRLLHNSVGGAVARGRRGRSFGGVWSCQHKGLEFIGNLRSQRSQ
jgi:hypothetical protein